ncbi:MAG: tRNA (adenosine(37)-N6)-threonylcarbamoyltransferase complex ATPase subunit type 1 TsaE [Patescibacteria group bacterium]
MKEYPSHSLEETEKIAKNWLGDLVRDAQGRFARDEAMVVGLSGHLGSGKTTFTQIIGKLLGITEIITSPTFVIMKIYEIGKNDQCSTTNVQLPDTNRKSEQKLSEQAKVIPWKRLIHIDAYRLESGKELDALNFEKLVSDSDNLILIEWPENVKSVLLPENLHQDISFSILDTSSSEKTDRVIGFNQLNPEI